MSEVTLSVSIREGAGRGVARRLRAQGQIPAVIYGGDKSQSLSVGERDFLAFMRKAAGSVSIIKLNDAANKSSWTALMQATQRNPRTDRFEHIDFLEVSADREITASIPVTLSGESIGVKMENGIVDQMLYEVEVACLPKDLPEGIELDLTEMHVGDAVHIKNLPEFAGVRYSGDEDTVIVSVVEQVVQEEEPEVAEEAADDADADAKQDDEADAKATQDGK